MASSSSSTNGTKVNKTVDAIKLALSCIVPISALIGIGIAWGVLSARVDSSWDKIKEVQADQIRTNQRLDLIEQRLTGLESGLAAQATSLVSIEKKLDYILARVDQLNPR